MRKVVAGLFITLDGAMKLAKAATSVEAAVKLG
jgi:hypothetical protein